MANPATNDFSDYFEIFTPIVIDTLVVTIPDNLTAWETGTTHSITWTSTGSVLNVKLELYENDVFVMEIVASTPDDGSYSWIIPTTLGDSNLYQIKITDVANPSTYDESPYFALTAISTGGGETPSIMGYNVFLILGGLCIFSIILVNRKFKKLRHI